MSATVACDRPRVWQALTHPDQRLAWEEQLVAPVAPSGRAAPGHAAGAPEDAAGVRRWRYRLGCVQLVLSERERDVLAPERLSRQLVVASLRLEQHFRLTEEREAGRPRTRVALKLVAPHNCVPVLGEIVDRFAVRRLAVASVDRTLRALSRFCEADPGAPAPPAPRSA